MLQQCILHLDHLNPYTFVACLIEQVISIREENSLVIFFGTFHLKLIYKFSVFWKIMDEISSSSQGINMNSMLLTPRSHSWTSKLGPHIHSFVPQPCSLTQVFTHTSLPPQCSHTLPPVFTVSPDNQLLIGLISPTRLRAIKVKILTYLSSCLQGFNSACHILLTLVRVLLVANNRPLNSKWLKHQDFLLFMLLRS